MTASGLNRLNDIDMRLISIYLLAIFIAIAATGCSDDILPERGDIPASDGTPVTITTGASFPEMNITRSRAMNDEPTVDDLLNNLHVNLFVFDPAGVMLQFIGPEDISVLRIDETTRTVYFNVRNIYSSSEPRRLHFVVTEAPDLHDIPGGDYISAMASETTVMPALVMEGGCDAYWGIKDVAGISADMNLNVKLIRNFVKISVKDHTSRAKFKMSGYTVVNRPGSGTVAPYIYKDHLFAAFLDSDDALLSYEDITAQGYHGVNPAGADETMTCTDEAEIRHKLDESERLIASGTDSPCYIYERSQSSLTSAGTGAAVTYLIVSGEYAGEPCYYKIDIGKDMNGKFGYYDLLRNFQYTVSITEVGGKGAPTLREAMSGAPHNNLSASVVTRDLFSIGYGGEKIEVSATQVIFTEKTADYTLRFRYTVASGASFNPKALKIYDMNDESVEYDMDGAGIQGGKDVDLSGPVIKQAAVVSGNDGWYELRISTSAVPTDSRRLEQNIRIYYTESSGLGRTVTFMLRRPWELSDVKADTPSSALGADLTVSYMLPSGLSKTMFPLAMTFESDKQNIYAVNGSPLKVAVGLSGFQGAGSDRVMYYVQNIEWAEYSRADGSEGGLFTARFRLNTTSAEDRQYNTSALDGIAGTGRVPNNGKAAFCIRVANQGMKYLNPVYINVQRN